MGKNNWEELEELNHGDAHRSDDPMENYIYTPFSEFPRNDGRRSGGFDDLPESQNVENCLQHVATALLAIAIAFVLFTVAILDIQAHRRPHTRLCVFGAFALSIAFP